MVFSFVSQHLSVVLISLFALQLPLAEVSESLFVT